MFEGQGWKREKGHQLYVVGHHLGESHHVFTLEGTSSCSIHRRGIQEGTFAVNMGAPGGGANPISGRKSKFEEGCKQM